MNWIPFEDLHGTGYTLYIEKHGFYSICYIYESGDYFSFEVFFMKGNINMSGVRGIKPTIKSAKKTCENFSSYLFNMAYLSTIGTTNDK